MPRAKFVERDAGDRRLPHVQVAGGDRADAAGERHHAPGASRPPSSRLREGMTPARAREQHDRRDDAQLGGSGRRRAGHLRQVHRVSARQRAAAAAARGRRRAASTRAAPWRATRRTSRARRCSASRRSGRRDVWDIEKRAQDAAFAAAQMGATCESVDAAARKVITDAGFGPDYKVPGLPHRTGHGIGLDGHEWTNFVRGNTTPIAPGHVLQRRADDRDLRRVRRPARGLSVHHRPRARFFSPQSVAIDQPFA